MLLRRVGRNRSMWRGGVVGRAIQPASALSRHHFSSLQGQTTLFALDKSFVDEYAKKPTSFGFNGLGEMVYLRSYSRDMVNPETGVTTKEKWHNTVERVVNGTFRMQQEWMCNPSNRLPWDEVRAQQEAQDMYQRMFEMKFLPPGRGLWAMGTFLTSGGEEEVVSKAPASGMGEDGAAVLQRTVVKRPKMYAALNNCAFVSTAGLRTDSSRGSGANPFCFLMDASMLGVGVGFDTLGAGGREVWRPVIPEEGSELHKRNVFVVPDSREGWVDSVRLLLSAFLDDPANSSTGVNILPSFDYSLIRPAGLPIRGFGGTSQGPGILMQLHESLTSTLTANAGNDITVTTIVDIMNLIGRCVVAGNVRRTAEIAFGRPDDSEYTSLKDYDKNPHRADFGWTSNNSVFATVGMDYSQLCGSGADGGAAGSILRNGEPGFAWLENMQSYSRMQGEGSRDYKDIRAMGGNPCLEQTLESYEMCCLVETFPHRHLQPGGDDEEALQDYMATLRVATMYAKTVTLGATHWPETNSVLLRNRRIGCSMSGLAQFITQKGLESLRTWCETGYDAVHGADVEMSERFAVPVSIKKTSIKPSGTVSLLAGATPGMHYPESRFYLRRVRLLANSPLVVALQAMGYHTEPDVTDPEHTVVVELPVDINHSGASAPPLSSPPTQRQDTSSDPNTSTSTSVSRDIRTLDDVSLWEQLSLAAFLQRHWADNQVSCTATFDPESEGAHLEPALNYFQYHLKGISFLPRKKNARNDAHSTPAAYAQMPYEALSREKYEELVRRQQERGAASRNLDPNQSRNLSDLYCALMEERNSRKAADANANANHASSGASAAANQETEDTIELPDRFCDVAGCTPEQLRS